MSVGRALAGRGNLYARAAVSHEFDGKTDVRVVGDRERKEKLDFGGTGFEFGAGASVKLGKSTHLYADLEKSFGSKVTTTWQWNAGLWYDF